MSVEVQDRWRAYRWTRWGPATTVRRRNSVEVTVGDAVVEIDLTDHRPAAEIHADPWRSVYDDGVAVAWDGRHVATITTATDRSGVGRRARLAVTGDERFVLPDLGFTHRALPKLVTLHGDGRDLVASRRWASPLNMAVVEWSYVREHDLVPPRVAADARAEHIALWLAVKEDLTL